MLLSKAVCPGPCPVVPGLTSTVYVLIVCVPVSVALLSLLLKNRAHSSATLVCEPLGLNVMAVVLPPAAASKVVAVVVAELLSAAGPLLMKMIKFFWHSLLIGLK